MSQAAPVVASTPGASLLPDSTGLFTTAHFLWIALFAAVVVAAIILGVRQKAQRQAGERTVERHNQELRDTPPPPPVVAPPPADGDGPASGPVTQLKGLGPKVAQQLGELGITTVGQLAALTDDDAAALDARMGPFAGRMHRDRWQEQARFLAAGDKAGFEAVFGRL